MQDETMRTEAVVDNTDYIEALKNLKENSVERSKYDALRADNKRLLEAVVNGQTVENVPTKTDDRPVLEIIKDFQNSAGNADKAKYALEYRQALINQGKQDPFLPFGHDVIPTEEDITKANHVAEVFQNCLEYAEGNSEVFTNELMRLTVDTAPMSKRK